MYDVFNAVTNIASNSNLVEDDPGLAYRLMRVGGRLSSHSDICNECHRVL